MSEEHWICVSVSSRFVLTHDVDELTGLFRDILGDDYVSHHVIDPDETPQDESGCYVLLCCREYKPHLEAISCNPHFRGVLNSYDDVCELSEEEVRGVRKTVSVTVKDGDYVVNRTRFLMFGDIIQVKHGPLVSMHGIVVGADPHDHDRYTVLFRLFTRAFMVTFSVDDLTFTSSVYHYHRFPVSRRNASVGREVTHLVELSYRASLERRLLEALVDSPPTSYTVGGKR